MGKNRVLQFSAIHPCRACCAAFQNWNDKADCAVGFDENEWSVTTQAACLYCNVHLVDIADERNLFQHELLGSCALVFHILKKHYIGKLYGTANQWRAFQYSDF